MTSKEYRHFWRYPAQVGSTVTGAILRWSWHAETERKVTQKKSCPNTMPRLVFAWCLFGVYATENRLL